MNKTPSLLHKKVPMRKCIVTNLIFPKQELMRIILDQDGQPLIDKTGKQNGRGAYLQPKLTLIPLLKKNKSLERALKIKIKAEFYETIIKEIQTNWD